MFYMFSKKSMDLKNSQKQISPANSKTKMSIVYFFMMIIYLCIAKPGAMLLKIASSAFEAIVC
jgi:hypothetical protein